MRRNKKLGDDILVAMFNNPDGKQTFVEVREAVIANGEYSDEAIKHHLDLLEDVGLVKSMGPALFRLTSAGHDRAENTDKPDSMETWRALGS